MFSNPTFILLIISVLIAAVCAFLILSDKKKVQPALMTAKPLHSTPQLVKTVENDLPPIIDRPSFTLSDDAEITYQKEEHPLEMKLEIDDKETALLKAAEIVVEKVQDVVTHIASNPPNSEEITSKIKAIVNPYAIFHGTEYFDAINSFIAITVERDCNVQLTKEELLALWN